MAFAAFVISVSFVSCDGVYFHRYWSVCFAVPAWGQLSLQFLNLVYPLLLLVRDLMLHGPQSRRGGRCYVQCASSVLQQPYLIVVDGWMDVYFVFARMVLEVHLWRGKHKITGWYITTSINL